MNETQRGRDGMTQRNEDELSFEIIGAAIEVHRTLGRPGLLVGIYESNFFVSYRLRFFAFHISLKVNYVLPIYPVFKPFWGSSSHDRFGNATKRKN
jgi:hypothetical protein